MENYELMLILKQNVAMSEIKKKTEKYLETVVKKDGKIKKIDILGKQKLAYEINKEKDGVYVVVYFETEKLKRLNELSNLLKINSDIIRHKLIKLEK